MVVGARLAGLSVSETADLLGFSFTMISRVYTALPKKEKISSEWQLSGLKCFVDTKGQRRKVRLFRADKKSNSKVTQIITGYNQGMQKSTFGYTTCCTLKQMGYSSVTPMRVPFLSAKNRNLRLRVIRPNQNCTIKVWKNDDES